MRLFRDRRHRGLVFVDDDAVRRVEFTFPCARSPHAFTKLPSLLNLATRELP